MIKIFLLSSPFLLTRALWTWSCSHCRTWWCDARTWCTFTRTTRCKRDREKGEKKCIKYNTCKISEIEVSFTISISISEKFKKPTPWDFERNFQTSIPVLI